MSETTLSNTISRVRKIQRLLYPTQFREPIGLFTRKMEENSDKI